VIFKMLKRSVIIIFFVKNIKGIVIAF